jgi:hypothetical protein
MAIKIKEPDQNEDYSVFNIEERKSVDDSASSNSDPAERMLDLDASWVDKM